MGKRVGKSQVKPIINALIICNSEGQRLGTCGTARETKAARNLCPAIFRQYPLAEYVKIIPWKDGANLEDPTSVIMMVYRSEIEGKDES